MYNASTIGCAAAGAGEGGNPLAFRHTGDTEELEGFEQLRGAGDANDPQPLEQRPIEIVRGQRIGLCKNNRPFQRLFFKRLLYKDGRSKTVVQRLGSHSIDKRYFRVPLV